MKKKLISILLATGAVFTISSCENQQSNEKISAFHELKTYFDSELLALKKSDLLLSKTIVNNGKTETLVVTHPDWPAELVPFTEFFSGQPVPLNSYQRDSMMSGNGKVISLTARDSSTPIKSVKFFFTGNTHDSTVIVKQVRNSYYSSSDTLIYYGKGNYLIRAVNNPALGKSFGFVVEGKTSEKK